MWLTKGKCKFSETNTLKSCFREGIDQKNFNLYKRYCEMMYDVT